MVDNRVIDSHVKGKATNMMGSKKRSKVPLDNVSFDRSRRHRARAKGRNHCPLKVQYTASKQGRSLCRSIDEAQLNRVRTYHSTQANKKAYHKRTVWVEPLFAEGKD